MLTLGLKLAHPQFRLKQQQLRPRDTNGKCVEKIPILNFLLPMHTIKLIMAALTSLPEELYHIVTSYASEDSLLTLALTSKTFNRHVTPMIYCCPYFHHHDQQGSNLIRVNRSFNCDACFGRVSEIVQLPLFLRTIAESPYLRSYIQAADFQWQSYERNDIDTVISQILSFLPHDLKALHLSITREAYPFPSTLPITSLQLHYPGGIGVGRWDGEFDLPFEDVYSVFQISTLKHLTYIDARHFDHFPPGLQPGARAKTSNVTSLAFLDGAAIGEDFFDMMTWPVALKTIHMRFFPDEAHLGDRHDVSPARLREALLPQRDSLEEIFLEGVYYALGHDNSILGSLHEFSALKRLGAAVDYLCPREWNKAEESDKIAPDIYEVLPSTLEELQLEAHPGFSWRSRPVQMKPRRIKGSRTHPHLSATGDDLRERLLKIAYHKEGRYPNLKTVAVYYIFSERYRLLPDEDPPEITELFETFDDAGIELFCGACKDPPLFGPCMEAK